ncbi:MAG: iron-sulfur cluster assembly protein [Candidatus Micrarchaeota archaeon]
MVSRNGVLGVLKTVLDPEIAFNIVDLGLVYGVAVSKDGVVGIAITLTTPACPMGPEIVEEVKRKVRGLKGVKEVNVDLVWEPPWTPEKMSGQAKIDLGFG